MRRFLLILMLGFLLPVAGFAGPGDVRYSLERMSVRGCGDMLEVSVDWSFHGKMDDGAALIVKLSLRSDLGEANLAPVVVYGRKAFYGKEVASGDERENAYLMDGESVSFSCKDAFPYAEWMDTVRVSLAVYEWTKRTGPFLVSSSSRRTFFKPSRPEEPMFPWTMKQPARSGADLRTVTFECPVMFDGKSTKFNIEFGDNLETVGDFIPKVRAVASSKLFSVRSSSISVFLPPEEDAASVRKRSLACAQSLYSYMARAGAFRVSVPQRKAGGEDWKDVRDWIERSEFGGDERIREILSWEGRDDELYSFLSREKPAAWEKICTLCLPSLGRAVYTASFKPLVFSKPNFVIPVYEETPEALSPYDFYYLSGIYEEMSEDWFDVICTGAMLNPGSEELNMDAAMGFILSGSIHGAVPYLRHVGSSDDGKYVYALWLFKCGRYAEALDIFKVLDGRKGPYQGIWSSVYPFSKWITNDLEWVVQ